MVRSSKVTSDKEVQLQQKLIHYRSEVIRSKQIIERQENEIKNQKESIQSLMKRLSEIQENAEILPNNQSNAELNLQFHSFFSYSVIIPKRKNEEEHIIIKGLFTIVNTGTQSIHSPVICLEFNQPEYANLSGKIQHSKQSSSSQFLLEEDTLEEIWAFIEGTSQKEAKKTGRYWLKPTNSDILLGNTTLSTFNFEVLLPSHQIEKNLVIQGYVYSEEMPEGKPSNNKIIFNFH
ncbi:hypothetical protein RYX56_11980 [Alkalihalophilus lindianensis]|uniref:Uncharacterized protein n=1 Tax=Alkalihalophilus lindianensis TaxID=1630542 RepID=A0ABU3XB23_9BACI|nr:hypothetical protein [Alkalihalophilus lindianensis]MDV2685091.1 hypothetical protein [Alkalihalophilus lindianensis]